jgi:hypothetical protein
VVGCAIAAAIAACGGGADDSIFGSGTGSTATGTGTGTTTGITTTGTSTTGTTTTATGHGGAGGAGGGGGAAPIVCADTPQCVAKLGGDACKVDIACDPKTSVCTWRTLDKDGDGHPPLVCQGDDCDDADATVFGGAAEVCDGRDNDCDQTTDEDAACPSPYTCQAGMCACPPANLCGGACVDLGSTPAHCGACGHACPPGAACTAGACVCPGGATECGGACTDTKTDAKNCGGCGKACSGGFSCVAGSCFCPKATCGEACVDLAVDTQNCGGCGKACPVGATCQQGQCTCPAPLSVCFGQCVDTQTDVQNCGGCGGVCPGTCQNGACQMCPVADLFLMQDASGSMVSTLANGLTRMQSCRQGIEAFMAEPASAGIGLGLGFHNLQVQVPPSCTKNEDCGPSGQCFGNICLGGGVSCSVADYATPVVAIASLPGNASAIATSLANRKESGSSTPPQALEGALTYAKSYAAGHPNHAVSVVFVADSLSGVCTAVQDHTELAGIAAKYAQGLPTVLTYIVGIASDVPKWQWDAIAAAGGTGVARVALSAADVTSALDQIRDSAKYCP